jgi:hypothetical protein
MQVTALHLQYVFNIFHTFQATFNLYTPRYVPFSTGGFTVHFHIPRLLAQPTPVLSYIRATTGTVYWDGR